jgi:glycosyltransferase involved in cell wall biosynthesis
MNVAVYHPWIYLRGGIERTLLELVRRSRHSWRIFTNRFEPQSTFEALAELKITELKPVSVKRSMPAVLSAGLRIAGQKLALDGCDALVILCDGLGDLATFRNHRLPTFAICFTPLRAAYDAVYERAALSGRRPPARAVYKLFKAAFRLLDRRAWKRYGGVIAISSEVKRRIIEGGLYRDGPRLRLCHPGIDWQAVDGRAEGEAMALVPGRIMWTKNIELAIDAFTSAALPEPWRLVVAGFLDRKSGAYLDQLKARAGQDGRVDFIASPSESQLADLYRRASVVLFPPLNEDWGIVPLEAMAWSKPVVANARGGPLESIDHGRTGLLLEPDVDAWAEALRQLVREPERFRDLGRRGREHVRQYDWSRFAEGVDSALEQWVR